MKIQPQNQLASPVAAVYADIKPRY